MADSDERKSMEEEHDSDEDDVSALLWTARRLEASDDDEDGGEEVLDRDLVKGKYRRSSVGLLDYELDDLDGEELGGGVTGEEELEEGELQETVHVDKGKEKKDVNDDVFVPRHGSFYMHDDRFRSRRYDRRRGTMMGMKLWDCRDKQKWKHDKFEDTLEKSAPKSYHRQQGENRSQGHSYVDTNQFGSHYTFGNRNKTSRIVRGRGPVKYKPIVKSNNINPSSIHQIPTNLKEGTSSSRSPGVPSGALAISLDSSIETLPQITNFEHDLVGRGHVILHGPVRASSQLGCGLSPWPVMQFGSRPCGSVDDHAPSIAPAGYTPQSRLGSRSCVVGTSVIPGAAKPCNVNNPPPDRSASELVENEFRRRWVKPQRYSKNR